MMTFYLIILSYASSKDYTIIILKRMNKDSLLSPSTQFIFKFPQLSLKCLLQLFCLSQKPQKNCTLHWVVRSLKSLLIQKQLDSTKFRYVSEKGCVSLGGQGRHKRLCSWLRILEPIIILHIINSKSDEVLLALVQNLL